MKRILQFIPSFDVGGIESLLLSINDYMDKEKFLCDFLIENPISDDNKRRLEQYGGKVIYLKFPKNKFSLKNIVNYFRCFDKILKEGKYDVFHCHIWTRPFVIPIVKHNKIKTIVAHSHSKDFNDQKHLFVQKLFLKYIVKNSNLLIGCSEEAGKFAFGNRKFVILNNGIDFQKFEYNEKLRNDLRNKFKIGKDDIVFINVGRFAELKNQMFLLKVFSVMLKQDDRLRLFLLGKGPLEDDMNNFIEEQNIKNKVYIIKGVEDASPYLSFSDYFIFPSKSEGLGIAFLEAQANGLKCIISDGIPKKAIFKKDSLVLSLSKNENIWASEIKNYLIENNKYVRESVFFEDYDVKNVIKKYEKLLCEGVEYEK